MPNEEDFRDNPPIEMGKSIESRCETHPSSHGSNYREHLEKDHITKVEA